jgi:Asp-tRNA(Asn)/Glu-tRNA(Gln) amidotransferase A subunit family amidase
MDFCAWWKSEGLDHIITPGFGCQPNLVTLSEDLWPCVMYTFIWNLLNMPAGALPVTLVREDEEHYESTYNDILTRALRQNVEGSAGLPVGVLVIGQPFGEEKVLSLMKSLEGPLDFARHRKCLKLDFSKQ